MNCARPYRGRVDVVQHSHLTGSFRIFVYKHKLRVVFIKLTKTLFIQLQKRAQILDFQYKLPMRQRRTLAIDDG